MAVCGRCLICGYKFDGRHDDGTEPDAAIRWECKLTGTCAERAARRDFNEPHEHAICTTCHDHLVNDKAIKSSAAALLALVRERVLELNDFDREQTRKMLKELTERYFGDEFVDEFVELVMEAMKI